ncbi:hypothetical protein H9V85_004045 [Salmonella enterica subsp. enterica serovar Louisiana]|nr:hypothetical protein [Salmonella enterica subsp. enterica serovar Louisiana]ECD3929278.1 hypothetical protein [Salmonella enterica subsp. enterica serovar Wangata]EEC0438213.1 hypothetical protein [Salmonella enterica subsp. enterica]EEE9141780.1 hypothetical protein [Salmonella enterica subsp. enterica serovar Plymouth]EGZ3876473.1 hypothetical protein [Salmonella enterica subsp. enterica serovar Elokate]ELF6079991.1 hypothetical protein [Salmonella enterica]
MEKLKPENMMKTLAGHTRPGMQAAMVLCETVEYKAATTERLQPGRMRDFSVQRVPAPEIHSRKGRCISTSGTALCSVVYEHDIHATLSLR